MTRDLKLSSLKGHVYALEDKTGSLSLADVRKLSQEKSRLWRVSKTDVLSYGVSSSTFWFSLKVRNSLSEDIHWFLDTSAGFPCEAWVYQVGNQGTRELFHIKPFTPGSQLPMVYSALMFPIFSPAGEDIELFLKFRFSSSALVVPALMTRQAYETRGQDSWRFFGICYGFFILMAAYHLIIFFKLKDVSYLFYSAYIVFLFGHLAGVNGHVFQYVLSEAPNWSYRNIHISITLAMFALFLFVRSFTDMGSYSRLLNRIFLVLALCTLLLVPFHILSNDFALMIRVSSVYVGLAILFQYGSVAYLGVVRKSREALYYMVASTLVVVGGILFILAMNDFLPVNEYTYYGTLIGAACEVVVISLGLAHRLKVTARDKRLSRDRYHQLLANSKDLIFSLDKRYRFISVNSAAYPLLKYSPEALIGKSFPEIFIHEIENKDNHAVEYVRKNLEQLSAGKNTLKFKGLLYEQYHTEPREFQIRLEMMDWKGSREIVGKASPLAENLMSGFLLSEDITYGDIRSLRKIEVLCRKVTRNLKGRLSGERIAAICSCLNHLLMQASTELEQDNRIQVHYELHEDSVSYLIKTLQPIGDRGAVLDVFDSEELNDSSTELTLCKKFDGRSLEGIGRLE